MIMNTIGLSNYAANQACRSRRFSARSYGTLELIEMPPLDYLELSRQLSAIGNMINQITRIANTTGYIHIDALEQHYADVNEILQIVKRGFIESKDELSVHKKPTRRKTSCKR